MGEVSEREYLESLIKGLDRHLSSEIGAARQASEAAQLTAEKAVATAASAVERRLEALNELRELVGDYQRTLMPRAEATQRFDAIDEKIDKLEDAVSARVAHAGGLAAGWGYLVGAVGLLAIVITAFIG